MAFIQHSAGPRSRIPLNGETGPTGIGSVTASRRIATRRGLWRVGGLLGGLAFSLACWVLIYHGVTGVIAWTKPTAGIASAAQTAPSAPPQSGRP